MQEIDTNFTARLWLDNGAVYLKIKKNTKCKAKQILFENGTAWRSQFVESF